MDLVVVLLCVYWSIGCGPSLCEPACDDYRDTCGTERSYDCAWVCEEAETPRTDRGCAECWMCLGASHCPELTLYETEETPACWNECHDGCFGELASDL